MADGPEDSDVSRQLFSVAYAGQAADVHSIDVEALAPALLAFGKLIRAANAEFNGDRATAKVLVASDFEHKCFNINFESVVSVIETIKGLMGIVESTKSAREILEWLGILSPPGAAISYLGYLKWKRGRKIIEKTELADQDVAGTVRVTVEGVTVTGDGNTIIVSPHILNLAANPKALKATRDAFTPIGQDGFDRVELRDGEALLETIEADETQAILASCNEGIDEADKTTPNVETTTAWLSVYSPVLDPQSDKWRFRLGMDKVYVDISETQIAERAVERGGVMLNDAYHATLEITTPRNSKGKAGKPSYKILNVIKFVPGSLTGSQGDLFGG
jgi:hypothetical protein